MAKGGSGERIDAINVGLGVDATSLKSLQGSLSGIKLEPQLVLPNARALEGFAKGLSSAMMDPGARSKLGVKVAVTFDEAQAKSDLESLANNLSGAVSVEIPIRWTYPDGDEPRSPSGGGGDDGGGQGGTGGTGRRRGRKGKTTTNAEAATAAAAAAGTAAATSNVKQQTTQQPKTPRPGGAGAPAAAVVGAAAGAAVAGTPKTTVRGQVQSAIAGVMGQSAVQQPEVKPAAPGPQAKSKPAKTFQKSPMQQLIERAKATGQTGVAKDLMSLSESEFADIISSVGNESREAGHRLSGLGEVVDFVKGIRSAGQTARVRAQEAGGHRRRRSVPMSEVRAKDELYEAIEAGGGFSTLGRRRIGRGYPLRGVGELLDAGKKTEAVDLFFRQRYGSKKDPRRAQNKLGALLRAMSITRGRPGEVAEDYPLEFALLSHAGTDVFYDESGDASLREPYGKTRGSDYGGSSKSLTAAQKVRNIERVASGREGRDARRELEELEQLGQYDPSIPLKEQPKDIRGLILSLRRQESSQRRVARARDLGITSESPARPRPLPPNKSKKVLAEEEAAREAARKALLAQEKALTGRGPKGKRSPLDYSPMGDINAFATAIPYHERPIPLSERPRGANARPWSGSWFDLLTRGMAMGGPKERDFRLTPRMQAQLAAQGRSKDYLFRARQLDNSVMYAGSNLDEPRYRDMRLQAVKAGPGLGFVPGADWGEWGPADVAEHAATILEKAAASEQRTAGYFYNSPLEPFYGVHGHELRDVSQLKVLAKTEQAAWGQKQDWVRKKMRPMTEFSYSKNAMGGKKAGLPDWIKNVTPADMAPRPQLREWRGAMGTGNQVEDRDLGLSDLMKRGALSGPYGIGDFSMRPEAYRGGADFDERIQRSAERLARQRGEGPWWEASEAKNVTPRWLKSGKAMGGYRQGDRWYRGGSSAQDLFSPGRYVGDPYTKGHPEGGLKWRTEPWATLGAGLYMTDLESARKYADVRAERGDAKGLPIVGSRVVDIPEEGVWGPGSRGRKGNKWEHDDDLLDAWYARLHTANEELHRSAEGLMTVPDIAKQYGYQETMAAIRQARAGKEAIHIADAIGSRFAGNQRMFSEFMQAKGYQGLLAHEGGEYDNKTGGFFTHPTLVVFDPKSQLMHRALGGRKSWPLNDTGVVDMRQIDRGDWHTRGGFPWVPEEGNIGGSGEPASAFFSEDLKKKTYQRYGHQTLGDKYLDADIGPLTYSRNAAGNVNGRPSSLSDLPDVARNISHITEVGEQGREWIVTGEDGSEFIVPYHQLPHFKGMLGMALGGRRGRRQHRARRRTTSQMFPQGLRGERKKDWELDPYFGATVPQEDDVDTGWDDPYFGRTVPQVEDIDSGADYPGGGDPGWEYDPYEGPTVPQVEDPDGGYGNRGGRINILGGGRGPWSRRRLRANAEARRRGLAWGLERRPGEYGVGSAGLQILGYHGSYRERRAAAMHEGLTGDPGAPGATSSLSTPTSRDIQRVFVTNWPAGLEGRSSTTAPVETPAATPPPRLTTPSMTEAESGARSLEAAATDDEGETPEAGDVAGRGPRRPKISSSQKTQTKFAGAAGVTDLREQLDQVGIDISEALQKSPVRALSVAMGQIAQTMIGGRAGILQRAGQARAARGRGERIVSMLEGAEAQYDAVWLRIQQLQEENGVELARNAEGRMTQVGGPELSEKLTQALDALTEEEMDLNKNLQFLRPKAKEATQEAQAAAQGILTPGQQFKAQAVGVGGIVGGTLLFTTAMQIAQTGMSLAGKAAMEAADQLENFMFTTINVTEEFANVMQKSSGVFDAAAAGFRAQAGLPSGADIGNLTERAALMAGARQLQLQRDLYRSEDYLSATADTVEQIAGIGKGFSNGLLGSSILQQQGLVELYAGDLGQIKWPVGSTAAAARPAGRTTFDVVPQDIDQYRQDVQSAGLANSGTLGPRRPASVFEFTASESLGDFALQIGRSLDEIGSMTAEELEKAIRDAAVTTAPVGSEEERKLFALETGRIATGTGGALTTDRTEEEAAAAADQKEKELEATAKLTKQLDRWNLSLEEAESAYRWQQVSLTDFAEFAKTLRAVGATPGQIQQFREAQAALVGPRGQVATGYGFNREMAKVLESAVRPSAEDLMEEMRPAFEAQIASIRRNETFAREVEIPTAFWEQLASSPLPGINQFAQNIPTTTGIIGPNAGAIEAGIGGRYGAQIGRISQQMQPLYERGREQLINLGVSEKDISAVERLGASIARLSNRASQLQLGLEQAQYNEQLYITQRSLSDILGIMGQTGAETSKLGRLQRQQIQDQRELARIGLARSQRELDFQLALAKLRAPGETAEERAVRINEAQVRTREAQRELDINKRSTNRGFQIEDIGFARQARDLRAQLQLIQQARRVNVEVRGIQQVIEAKNQLLGLRRQFLGTGRAAAIEVHKAGFGILQAVEARLGTLNEKVAKEVSTYMDTWLRELMRMERILGAKPGGGKGSGGNTGSTVPVAAGMYHVTSGPTAFIAGEAGTEHVLVLRNPRTGMMSGGGGSGGNNIQINLKLNAEVRNEGDENRLAQKVARLLHDEVALLMGA